MSRPGESEGAPERVAIGDRFHVPAGVTSVRPGMLVPAVDRGSGAEVGLRRLPSDCTADWQAIARLKTLDHPSLLGILEVLADDQGVYFVTEWSERGTLANRLSSGGSLSLPRLFAVARDVSRALAYLHKNGIAPVDLDPQRILETDRGSFRVAGYGIPAALAEEATIPTGSAPEALSGDPRFRRDIEAFGDLISGLCERLPASLESVCARCHPGSPRSFTSADEITRAVSGLTEVKVLPEIVEPRRSASRKPPAAEAAEPRSGTMAQFPYRPAGELYRTEGPAMDGGMGSVRMARELATGRKVAIKRLLEIDDEDSNALQRFRREANSIANLSHPHILQLLQPARDEEGDYLVLEWAAGGSLRERLNEQGALPLDVVLDVARKIGGALAYAHRKGVIHRDIKPHNILLTETGEPKLADFGLARSTGDMTLSTSRGGAGSPLYMPPEQYDQSRKADARSDIYSLGKTLYQLVTNKSPASPQPKLIPQPLRVPLMRCMEEDPLARYATIDEFLADLDRPVRKPAWPLLVATAAAVLIAAAWIYQSLCNGEPAPGPQRGPGSDSAAVGSVPAGQGPGGGAVEPAVGGEQGVPITPVRADTVQPTLPVVTFEGLFDGEERLGDDGIDAANVNLHLRFQPAPVAGEEPKVLIKRGGEDLVRNTDYFLEWRSGGLLVVTVPLRTRETELDVTVPDFDYDEVKRILRVDPEVRLWEVAGQEVSGREDVHVTAERSVELVFGVSRAEGIESLWLRRGEGDSAAEEDVRIEGKKITHAVALQEGRNVFRLFWPESGEEIPESAVVVDADFTGPELSVERPPAGLTNQDRLVLAGKAADTHPGTEVVWQLERAGAVEGEGTESLQKNQSFRSDLDLPAGLEGDVTLRIVARDEVGNESATAIAVTVDRTPPALVGPPVFTGTFDAEHTLTGVALRGQASEALGSVRVNGMPATVEDEGGFSIAGLPPEEGDGYEVVLVDRAGNPSLPLVFGHGIDTEAPAAAFAFAEEDGNLYLIVTPEEDLKVLAVDGAEVEAGARQAARVRVEGTLAGRTAWGGENPPPGPTNFPISVEMTDAAGNRTALELVICPECKDMAVHIKRTAAGEFAGTVPCAKCGGQYCPRTGPDGPHKLVDNLPRDVWVRPQDNQCSQCRWPKK